MKQGTLHYCKGDATLPLRGDRRVVIPHVCNTVGGWGAGFTGSLSRLWPQPEAMYRAAAAEGVLELGLVQFVRVPRLSAGQPEDMTVANMVAQKGINGHVMPGFSRRPQLRYGALIDCMKKVREYAWRHDADIHCPWFGTALAGGHLPAIDHIIFEVWVEAGLTVYAYDYEQKLTQRGILTSEKPDAGVMS